MLRNNVAGHPAAEPPQCIIIMGVCGCGKSTFGRKLAALYGIDFVDADDFHPASNVDKMKTGKPLTDEDRWPWLHELAGLIGTYQTHGKRVVMGCSALKEAYREILRGQRAGSMLFVLLQPSQAELLKRLKERTRIGGHFMPASLLESQLATLEPEGKNIIAIQGDGDAEEMMATFLSHCNALPKPV
ncbi:hypothetical protein CVIRNUC_008725 [Coccomyxa viridis]|uniref:Gluconokinase n=1 Tax=Coccomyxa viridis TaxID=1274662 RepID=A0AAV1IGC6_9CHLO|nr:hypothetical protein CVIRNUC_008725 [Coccomyxa viridis]